MMPERCLVFFETYIVNLEIPLLLGVHGLHDNKIAGFGTACMGGRNGGWNLGFVSYNNHVFVSWITGEQFSGQRRSKTFSTSIYSTLRPVSPTNYCDQRNLETLRQMYYKP